MRELFPGYYPITDNDRSVLWEKGIFILDTNVLLKLYRYPNTTTMVHLILWYDCGIL